MVHTDIGARMDSHIQHTNNYQGQNRYGRAGELNWLSDKGSEDMRDNAIRMNDYE